ncbi:peptidoglycan DD-metalloendopeptidase family protein [Thermoflavimicrobium daqui]|jgi:stage IV sporulation protein FA|uniref:M23ase beta-sheet core domain-containing protein n=1 Tax=Thermoflavimicrobium daqui TaxID=2137476 RepID=A0A364K8P2_9BACL|nr:peptidoglycan DD-metalloendopeptidase family protein [Thermoflavimicrobium daqui]RAL26648.1 hypothetical protein DL897_00945 [Thermoflavimicrobium daqui]
MSEWGESIKKRRQKQVQLIRQGMYSVADDGVGLKSEGWGQKDWKVGTDKKNKKNKPSKLFIQTLISVFLLLGTYIIYQFQTNRGIKVQEWIRISMTKEFQFQNMADWYHKMVGGVPSILPAFQSKPKQSTSLKWTAPVQGKVVLPFDQKRKGTVLQTLHESQIKAVEEGWVTFAGEKPDLGNLVIIRHAQGYESWYGFVQNVKVKKKDWVKSGQLIGEVGDKKGQPMVYFALKKEDQFISPMGVIPFE